MAVPFFFMVTGHFVLGPGAGGAEGLRPRGRQIKKILLLYLIAVVLYLPIGWYAGHYQALGPLDVVRLLVFDGTFYHLWYFRLRPGAVGGVCPGPGAPGAGTVAR